MVKILMLFNNTTKGVFILLIINFLLNNSAFSNEDIVYQRYGLFSNYGIVSSDASFSSLPGIPNCCPEFTIGNGSALFFGGIFEYKKNDYSLEGTLSTDLMSGRFKNTEARTFGINGQPVPGKFEHIIDYNLNSFSAGLSLSYNFFSNFVITAGLNLSYIFNTSYHQFERISSPAGRVFFLDSLGNNSGSNVRNNIRGSLPDVNSFNYSTITRLGYEIPIKPDKSYVLRPEISYQYFFADVLNNTDWDNQVVRFGFSLVYSTHPLPVVEKQIEEEISINEKEDELRRKEEKLRQIEEEFLREQEEKRKYELALKEKDSLIATLNNQNNLVDKLEMERLEFDRIIQEENQKAGRECSCFVILFESTQDKQFANEILKNIRNSGYKNVNIKEFKEQYLQTIFYRVESECFKNHLDAFDKRIQIMNILENETINPRIICNR